MVKIYFAKFATLVLCRSLSKRTNILCNLYYLHFKWRAIFKCVLKDKPINIKIKSIMNSSINTTYRFKKFLVKTYFAKFATHVFCHSLSKRTNILFNVYYLHFKWRSIFKSVLKDKLINIKIKIESITNLSINTTYPLKKILVEIYFAKFATHVFCCSLSKRTNILWYVYYLYFKWRTIFKSVLKDKRICL